MVNFPETGGTWKEDDPRFLEGGAWIDDEKLHKDKRSYPGLGGEFSGKAKKEIDFHYLKKINRKKISEHLEALGKYRIGQWPK